MLVPALPVIEPEDIVERSRKWRLEVLLLLRKRLVLVQDAPNEFSRIGHLTVARDLLNELERLV